MNEQVVPVVSGMEEIEALRQSLPTPVIDGSSTEPRGVSFQMEGFEFERMEIARLVLFESNRSNFIKDAIAHYVSVIEETGARPGTKAARSKGDQIVELLEILGIDATHWSGLLESLIVNGALTDDSYWRLVFGRIVVILGE